MISMQTMFVWRCVVMRPAFTQTLNNIARLGRRWGVLSVILLTLVVSGVLAAPDWPAQAIAGPVGRREAAAAAPAALNWQLVNNSPGIFWYTIKFVDNNIGYAVGGPDWNVNNGNGQPYLAKTTNGGQTWAVTPILVGSTGMPDGFLRGLDCKDANTCWATGQFYLVRTTDGGASWEFARRAPEWSGWLWSLGYTGAGDTVLAGTTGYDPDPARPDRKANFLRATNGMDFNAVVADEPLEFVVYDFSCPDDADLLFDRQAHCMAHGERRRELAAHASRPTCVTSAWTVWTPTAAGRWAAAIASAAGAPTYTIMSTANGGQGWTQNIVAASGGARPRFYDVDMVDAQHGYAVGCTNAPIRSRRSAPAAA